MARYDEWHIEIHSEYGGTPRTDGIISGRSLPWVSGGDNADIAQRMATEYAENATEITELIDHRDNLRPYVWRLTVRPADLPDEPPVRVMVRVEAIIRGEVIYQFSECDWCAE